MKNIEKLKISFQKTLKEIINKKVNDFSGLGLLLYNSRYLSSIPHFPLKPSFKCPKRMFIGQKKTIEFLSNMSQRSHPCHDGYHFFNEKGLLTHISQYLAVPIVIKVIPNELHGARHLSAQFASYRKGVIAVGTIDSNHSSSYFEKGKYHVLDSWDAIYKRGKENYKYYNFTEPHEDIDEVSKLFKKEKVKRILDLGCGAGRNLFYLIKEGFNLYGIDMAREGINFIQKDLKEMNLKADLKRGDVFGKLPYKKDFFDAVVSVQVLQHGNLNQIKRAIKEVERVLKPGGLIFITLCGRYSKGKIRYCVVKTARKIAPRTYVPTIGNEAGVTHYVYDRVTIKEHYKNFRIIELWRDKKDYYCFLGRNKK